jgi:hypothetical protein
MLEKVWVAASYLGFKKVHKEGCLRSSVVGTGGVAALLGLSTGRDAYHLTLGMGCIIRFLCEYRGECPRWWSGDRLWMVECHPGYW